MRILLVDDVEEIRDFLERVLTKAGFQILSAVNGEEALEKLRSCSIDMVISDVLMPVMDGFSLCAAMKRDEKLKALPFVFLTGTYTAEEDKDLALRLGADRFVRKPVVIDELIRIIVDLANNFQTKEAVRNGDSQSDESPKLKLYNERLVHKLETKMEELEEEIVRREQAEKIIVQAKREWSAPSMPSRT